MDTCPKCGTALNIDEKASRRCFSCGFIFPIEKKTLSIFPVISLLISIIAFILYAVVLNGTNIIFIWIALSIASIIFPIASKYFRNKNAQSGKGLEITALVIGCFNSYFVFFAATSINLFLVYTLIAVVCVLYAKLFNNLPKSRT